MAPKSCKIKDQPSKLAKLNNAKARSTSHHYSLLCWYLIVVLQKQNKSIRPTRPAPSRAYPTCQHSQWTPSGYYHTFNEKTHRWTTKWVAGHHTPCDCIRTTPTVAVKVSYCYIDLKSHTYFINDSLLLTVEIQEGWTVSPGMGQPSSPQIASMEIP